jgi:phosphotransacetylase
MAVVHPCDATSLAAALDARKAGLIEPVLIGPRQRLETVASQSALDLTGLEIEDVPHSEAAAARGVELAVQGRVDALMKGSLHTDELMSAVAGSPLRTGRRMSHCFLMQTPAYPRPFIITDAAGQHRADAQGQGRHRAQCGGPGARLRRERAARGGAAAVETVNPQMPATLDAAALCKMADRGQIAGAVLDGPLAFDNAGLGRRGAHKGIQSDVAGAPTSWSCPTSRAATCWPSSSSTSAAPPAPASCSAPRADRADEPRRPARGAHRVLRGGAGGAQARRPAGDRAGRRATGGQP